LSMRANMPKAFIEKGDAVIKFVPGSCDIIAQVLLLDRKQHRNN